MHFKFLSCAALFTAAVSAAPTPITRRQADVTIPSRATVHVITISGSSLMLLDSGRVYVPPTQDPNGPPLPPIEVAIGHFDVKVVTGSGSDVLVQLRSAEGLCRTEPLSGAIVCADKFPDLAPGDALPAPAVFRAKYHEIETEDGASTGVGAWSLLGGSPSWSIDMAGGAGAAPISPNPYFDVLANITLEELVEN